LARAAPVQLPFPEHKVLILFLAQSQVQVAAAVAVILVAVTATVYQVDLVAEVMVSEMPPEPLPLLDKEMLVVLALRMVAVQAAVQVVQVVQERLRMAVMVEHQ